MKTAQTADFKYKFCCSTIKRPQKNLIYKDTKLKKTDNHQMKLVCLSKCW